MSKIKLLTTTCRQFDRVDVLFNCAADSVVKPDGKQSQQQQPHQQEKQSGE
jgi:hypothetical protein